MFPVLRWGKRRRKAEKNGGEIWGGTHNANGASRSVQKIGKHPQAKVRRGAYNVSLREKNLDFCWIGLSGTLEPEKNREGKGVK